MDEKNTDALGGIDENTENSEALTEEKAAAEELVKEEPAKEKKVKAKPQPSGKTVLKADELQAALKDPGKRIKKGKIKGNPAAKRDKNAKGKDSTQALKFAFWLLLGAVGGMIVSNVIAELIAFIVKSITHTGSDLGSVLGACILMAISFALHFIFAALFSGKSVHPKRFLAGGIIVCGCASLIAAIIMLLFGSTDLGTMVAGIFNMSYLVVNMLLSGTAIHADAALLIGLLASIIADSLFTLLGVLYTEARTKEKQQGLS